MSRVAALLRGVNVGGRARVAMGELRDALTTAGLEEVQTLLQSGNVVFDAGPKSRDDAGIVKQVISERFGLNIEVILRSAKQLESIVAKHPMADPDSNRSLLHVVFLAARPGAKSLSALEPDRFTPDRFVVDGQEVFVSYPNGQGRSKLTLDYFEKTLAVKGTMRNLNTVGKLAELTRE